MLFAIGDVHGHFDKLMDLMAHCRAMAEHAGARARFVLLGDYIDRGPSSNAVLAFLASRPANVQSICGNHEQLMLQAADSAEIRGVWYRNGGLETLDSYRAKSVAGIPHEHIEAVSSLPTFIDDGQRLFVHAGIDAADPDARDPKVLMWTRRHPPDDALLPRFVVHGHTPTADARPDLRPNRLNLDTGAGFGRVLTAAAFDAQSVWPVCFVTHLGEVSPARSPVPI